MSEYNIQMNKYNALNAEYDQLYPQPMKHASTHAKDGNDPITPSSIEAAPSTHASQHASGGADPITPAAIGAATAIHTHAAGDIISGILPVARGGTGVSSLEELASALGGCKIETGSYRGTDSYRNTNIKLSFKPKLLIVFGSYSSTSNFLYVCLVNFDVGYGLTLQQDISSHMTGIVSAEINENYRVTITSLNNMFYMETSGNSYAQNTQEEDAMNSNYTYRFIAIG